MSLTRPTFSVRSAPSSADRKQRTAVSPTQTGDVEEPEDYAEEEPRPVRKRNLFEMEAFVSEMRAKSRAGQDENDHSLKTTRTVFHGKEKDEDLKASIFNLDAYNGTHEDPGMYRLSHFDEPSAGNTEWDSRSLVGSETSVAHFALSRLSGGRTRNSFYPKTPNTANPEARLHSLLVPSMAPSQPLQTEAIGIIVREALDYLRGESYTAQKCQRVSKSMSDYILYRLKSLDEKRIRFVCLVHIGAKADQGITIASRFLWNDTTDTYVSETMTTNDLFAVATVFCLYYE